MLNRMFLILFTLNNFLKIEFLVKSSNVVEKNESLEQNPVIFKLKTPFKDRLASLKQNIEKLNSEDVVKIFNEIYKVVDLNSETELIFLEEIYNNFNEMFKCEERISKYIHLTINILKILLMRDICNGDDRLFAKLSKLEKAKLAFKIYKELWPFICYIYEEIYKIKNQNKADLFSLIGHLEKNAGNKKDGYFSNPKNNDNTNLKASKKIQNNIHDNILETLKNGQKNIKKRLLLKVYKALKLFMETKKKSKRQYQGKSYVLTRNEQIYTRYSPLMELEFLDILIGEMINILNLKN